MSKVENGGPAFPTPHFPDDLGYMPAKGMTLRDYFAAKAMPECYYEVCRECDITGWPEDWKTGVAMDAYAMADAMLSARSQP